MENGKLAKFFEVRKVQVLIEKTRVVKLNVLKADKVFDLIEVLSDVNAIFIDKSCDGSCLIIV